MPRRRQSSASESDDGTSANSDDSLDTSKRSRRRHGEQSSTDSDSSRNSDASDEEAGVRRSKQSRSRSTLLPIILVFAILATSALAYYFYSRSATLPSADAQLPSNTDNSSEGGAVTMPDTPTEDGTTESSSATISETVTSSPTDDTSEATPRKSSSTEQTGTATKSPPATDIAKSTTAPAKSSIAQTTSSSTKTTTTQTPPSPTKVSNSGKKGAGYNKAEFAQQLGLDWAYNWASNPGGQPGKGVMYVPQLWGAKTDAWDKEATAAIEAGATHVLGFNEPDLAEQANLTPSQAAALWKAQIQKFSKSAKLVSPGVTNGVKTTDGKNMGVPWLLDFVAACDGCTIDAYALHWYDAAGNTDYFTSYLTDAHAKLKKPIWLTEFMGRGTLEEQKKFLQFAVPWLEKQDFIERYAVFGAFDDGNEWANFFAKDGSLTDLGKTYASL
ncbi:hypothetical protein JCM8115_000017 [Rhodotorula mucilaginosa]